MTPWTNELYSPWNSPGQSTGVGSLSFLQGIFPTYGTEPRSPALWVEFLPSEPQGKPKNTGVGSLSLLQWVFLTQESNWGLLHWRRILYQLSYEGSPKMNNHYVLFIFGNMEGRSNLVSECSNQINIKGRKRASKMGGSPGLLTLTTCKPLCDFWSSNNPGGGLRENIYRLY